MTSPSYDLVVIGAGPAGLSAASEAAKAGLKTYCLDKLAPGGVLATYTCSHHMQDAELRGVLADAASDAKRRLRVLEWCHQPSDHPVLAAMPETEYLRGYIVRAE